MLVLSHRGDHRQLPENTLPAFAAAVDQGADGIETDIRLLADGQLALFHDSHVPDGRLVAGLSLAELRAACDRAVPTLGEALAHWPGILWNLELKVPEALEPTLALVARAGLKRRPVVSSFWHPVVVTARQAGGVDVGFLVAHCPADLPVDLAGWWDADDRQRIVVWKSEFLDEATLVRARALGVQNWIYGLHTLAEHRHASEWGADVVITDRLDWGFAWRRVN